MEFSTTKAPDQWQVKLSGTMDDACVDCLQRLVRDLVAAPEALVLDLSRIGWINSAGARHWVAFLVALTKTRPRAIELAACSVHFVDFLNVIAAMAYEAHISSFYVPLACSRCETEQEHLQMIGDVDPERFAPVLSCPSCSVSMTPAVDWAEYIRFMGH